MASTRQERLGMTEDEVAEFRSLCHMVVGTIGKTGIPHLVTVSYGLKDGDVGWWAYGKSQKLTNLKRDNRITCVGITSTARSAVSWSKAPQSSSMTRPRSPTSASA
jgi:nitroimidazol reductase NimA-like FMN-containing flavoprotein (pyridoxamine 5'-phosphate oxidase superfamily)